MSLWQYQIKAEPVLADAERTTPDKWLPQDASANNNRRASASAVVLATTVLAFVPVVSAPTPTVSVDQWHPSVEQPLAQPSRSRYVSPALFWADVPRSVSIDRWLAPVEMPRRNPARAAIPQPAFVPVLAVPYGWQAQGQLPAARRQAVRLGGEFAPVLPLPNAVTIDEWLPAQVFRRPEPTRLYWVNSGEVIRFAAEVPVSGPVVRFAPINAAARALAPINAATRILSPIQDKS